MMRRALSFLVGLTACAASAGCRSGAPAVPSTTASPTPSAARVPPPIDHGAPAPARAVCVASDEGGALAPHVGRRSAALRLLLEGRPSEAERAFDAVLAERPTDVASYALRVAATSTRSAAFAERVRQLEHTKTITVTTALSSSAFTATPTGLPKTPATLELKVVSSIKGSGSTGPDWFAEHGVSAPDQSDVELPSSAQQLQGLFFSKALRLEDHEVFLFGDSLVTVDRDGSSQPRVVDFAPTVQSTPPSSTGARPGVLFARAVGKTLIAELGVTNDATSAPFPNGALVAIDLESGAVDWVSEPNVATALSFVVSGHYAIVGDGVLTQVGASSGHGFVRVVDLATGKVVDKKALDMYPQYVVEKDGKILVLGWDGGEAVLSAALPLDKAPAADLPGGPGAAPLDAGAVVREQCFIERAARALDARDGKAAIAEMDALDDRDGRAAAAIRAAGSFLVDAAARPDDVVDLTAKDELIVDAALPSSAASARTLGPAPKLTKKETQSTKPPVSKVVGLPPPPMPPPPPMEYAASVTFPVPDDYAGEALGRSFAYEDGNVLVYGRKHVAVLRDHKLENVFDISKLLGLDSAHADRPAAVLVHADVHGEQLVLCVARPSGGDGNQLYSLDASTGKLAWRSARDTCSVRFARLGDHIVAADGDRPRGATPPSKSKPLTYVIRADTGAVVSSLPIPSPPSDLGLSGRGRIVVVTDSDYVTFAIGY